MRALHLVKTAIGARWALLQMRELIRLGVQVHVAMPSGPLIDAYRAAGVTVHIADFDFPASALWKLPPRLRTLRELVDRIAPDVIHSHFVGTTLTMRAALGRHHRVPRVFQVPGPLHLEHWFFGKMELSSAGSSDYWIGSCRWTCREYRNRGVEEGRVFLSYYGTDVERLQSHRRMPSEAKWSSKSVGLVGYMYPPKWYLGQTRGLKGHEDLIDALAICRRDIPDLTGVFVGGAWNNAYGYYDRVVKYGQRSDPTRNIFLGTRSDILDLYGSFDAAVCPSHSENVGAAVESLLCGVPTIASEVGGLPDVVRNGETGWLVPPKAPAALAAAILDALGNEERARERARNGQKLVAELFDVRRTSAEVASIYQQLLEMRDEQTAHRSVQTASDAA